MDLHDFVKNFASQFENTDEASIKATSHFKDIVEWDSLMALTIIAMVDENYNAKLTGQDIRESVTVEDLYKKVKANL